MISSTVRVRYRLITVWLVVSIVGCAAQNLNREGMKLIQSGQRVEGLALLAQASREDPTNSRYRMDYLTQQALAVRDLLTHADAAFAAGNIEAARTYYTDALNVQPGNDRARRGLAAIEMELRHRAMIAEAERFVAVGDLFSARAKLRQVLLESSSNASAQRALASVNDRIERGEEAARQKIAAASVLKKPVTLQFRDANLRMVFEALSRTTGLNVILDRDVRADLKTTIFVRDASVGDSVDMILLQNQLDKKVLNANTLFVYPATGAKQKEYQDLKVRTFQISNADAKHLQNVLKSVLKVKDIALDERTNTLVMRDSAEAVAIAEKVIAAHDVPDSEVMLEVEVLEVARDRLSDIGILWPDTVTLSTPTTATTFGDVRNLSSGDLLITPLSVGVNLKLVDTDANLLASPRIRARTKEKARIMIGDKVPVITNSVTPIQTGSAVVTGTVQYLDVGIKLEVEPQIYAEGDVGIKLNLEVSNIVKEVRNLQSGTLAYQIGTRSAQTNLRLRDGETQILGGLISELDRNTASKVPGLGQLPVLGRLFSSHAGNTIKTEIILSITPRIVRSPAVADASLRDVYSGTDSQMRQTPLRLDPIGSVSSSTTGGTAAASSAPSASPTGRPPVRTPSGRMSGRVVPQTGEPAAESTVPDAAPSSSSPADKVEDAAQTPAPDKPSESDKPPASDKPAAPAEPTTAPSDPSKPSKNEPSAQRNAPTPTAAAAAPVVRGSVSPPVAAAASKSAADASGTPPEISLVGPAGVRVGEEFNVVLQANFREPTRSVPLVVRFDPLALSFVDAQPEALARAAGIDSAVQQVDAVAGRLNVELLVPAETPLVGQGKLLNLRFAATNSRAQTRIALGQITLPGEAGARTLPRTPTLSLKIGQ